ncbi:MAG: AMP-binding protein [Acidobacteriota bacterium]
MALTLRLEHLIETGLKESDARALLPAIEDALVLADPRERFRALATRVLRPGHPFPLHLLLFTLAYVDWDESRGPAPVWLPDDDVVGRANLTTLARDVGAPSYETLHRWSVEHRHLLWSEMVTRLHVSFREGPSGIVDLAAGVESPSWLPGARLNIAESCFQGERSRAAIVWQREGGSIARVTLDELDRMSSRAANGLRAMGLVPGDAVAIDMPMTADAVAIYLGIVKAGCAAIGIADSFAPHEVATRLRIGNAKAIVTQDVVRRGGKELPLYAKVIEAQAPRAIVLAASDTLSVALRPGDLALSGLLSANDRFEAVARQPDDVTNILFSSGTTGDPKAIPWTHTTPIKAAADGWLHHDVHEGDVLCWPTSLGWMMGPWLIYASLMNRASMALYDGAPGTAGFARFVEDARVTMLGVVPSLVKAWREGQATDGRDWTAIRCFSSTGECSNAADMHWLMAQAGYRPVIEYCGGTEIGGGYITGTVIQPAAPSTFTTPAMGLDFAILDEEGKVTDNGEVCLVPPSMGLSNALLNADHHKVYFDAMPRGPKGEVLRRHGDQIERLPGGYFRAHGRVDDTMNLGGIKVSSAEIERACNTVAGVAETAAIAINPPGGGPSLLVLYVVRDAAGRDLGPEALRPALQQAIRDRLNPLFKIHAVEVIDALPRTASNKVMRRMLRARSQGERP